MKPNDQDPTLSSSDDLSNAERKAKRKGDTDWSQVAGEGPKAPKQPNERDESTSSQEAGQALRNDPHAQAAFQDAAGPQQDTDRAAVTDKVYNDKVTDGKRTGDGESATGYRAEGTSTSSRDK